MSQKRFHEATGTRYRNLVLPKTIIPVGASSLAHRRSTNARGFKARIMTERIGRSVSGIVVVQEVYVGVSKNGLLDACQYVDFVGLEAAACPCILAGRRHLRIKNTKPTELTSTNGYVSPSLPSLNPPSYRSLTNRFCAKHSASVASSSPFH